MNIGLLLGSFDPIHIAHINIASCALNSGLCDKVLFVVAKHNPWKYNNPVPFGLRCEMIEQSIKPFGGKCEVCRLEENEEPPVYSYIPITKLLEEHSDDKLFIIAGNDTAKRISAWKNFDTRIKNKVGLIEVSRGEEEIGLSQDKPFGVKRVFTEESESYQGYYKLHTLKLDISSTVIRRMVENGMNPTPYVNENVLDIIIKNKLYTNGQEKV